MFRTFQARTSRAALSTTLIAGLAFTPMAAAAWATEAQAQAGASRGGRLGIVTERQANGTTIYRMATAEELASLHKDAADLDRMAAEMPASETAHRARIEQHEALLRKHEAAVKRHEAQVKKHNAAVSSARRWPGRLISADELPMLAKAGELLEIRHDGTLVFYGAPRR